MADPQTSDAAPLPCPRCGGEGSDRFYGPCRACRSELRERIAGTARAVGATAFEPAMHVTPNAVALKDG